MKSTLLLCLAVGVLPQMTGGVARGQSSFQNLDFESARIVPIPGDQFGRVEFGPAVPGWSGFIGDELQSLILYDDLFIGSPGLSLITPAFGAIDGTYSLVLQGGSALNAPDVAIAQFGLIPLGTESLLFNTRNPRNPFIVEIDGQAIPMFKLSEENGVNLYGGDISPYAGQSSELRIINPLVFGRSADLYLDSITFSTMQVPEPGVLGLVALGGAALLFRRWMVTRRRGDRRTGIRE